MSNDSNDQSTVITLRALEGTPLKQENIRSMIVATAHAIAERQGVRVIDLSVWDDRVTVMLETDRLVAIGFAAELRRLTTRWYMHKFGVDYLWGQPTT